MSYKFQKVYLHCHVHTIWNWLKITKMNCRGHFKLCNTPFIYVYYAFVLKIPILLLVFFTKIILVSFSVFISFMHYSRFNWQCAVIEYHYTRIVSHNNIKCINIICYRNSTCMLRKAHVVSTKAKWTKLNLMKIASTMN